MLSFEQPVVCLDTETTDLDPYNRVIWDIGMVRRDVDGDYTSKQLFVELSERQIERADPESLEINNFYDRYNAYSALSPANVAHQVNDFCRGAILAGLCIDFDVRTLEDFVRAHGLIPSWDYHILDLRTLATGYLAGVNLNEPVPVFMSQTDLADTLPVEQQTEDSEHTAIGDAEFNASILKYLLGEED